MTWLFFCSSVSREGEGTKLRFKVGMLLAAAGAACIRRIDQISLVVALLFPVGRISPFFRRSSVPIACRCWSFPRLY